MARPYSKKTVDEAELILLVLASNDQPGESFVEVTQALGIEDYTTAYRLADAALDATCRYEYIDEDDGTGYGLEAAALVRSGWMIGDPVELLPAPPKLFEKTTGKLAVNSTPEADAAVAEIEAVHANIFEKSEKDYADEVGATIDDGPTEALDFQDDKDPGFGPFNADGSMQTTTEYDTDPAPGDYGADS